jgi:hypothetical protein
MALVLPMCAQRRNPAQNTQIPTCYGETWEDVPSALWARERQVPDRPTINAGLVMTLD